MVTFDKELNFNDYCFYTNILLNEEEIGSIEAYVSGDEFRLTTIHIEEDYRGKGYGTEALELLKWKCQQLQIPHIVGDCPNSRKSFYRRNGAFFECRTDEDSEQINDVFYIDLKYTVIEQIQDPLSETIQFRLPGEVEGRRRCGHGYPLVGTIEVNTDVEKGFAVIEDFVVKEEYREMGYGSLMLFMYLDKLQYFRVKKVFVRISDNIAKRFFTGMGFVFTEDTGVYTVKQLHTFDHNPSVQEILDMGYKFYTYKPDEAIKNLYTKGYMTLTENYNEGAEFDIISAHSGKPGIVWCWVSKGIPPFTTYQEGLHNMVEFVPKDVVLLDALKQRYINEAFWSELSEEVLEIGRTRPYNEFIEALNDCGAVDRVNSIPVSLGFMNMGLVSSIDIDEVVSITRRPDENYERFFEEQKNKDKGMSSFSDM